MEMDRFKLPKRLFDDFRMIFYGLSILKAVLKWWSMTRFEKKQLKIVWFLLSRSLEYQQPRSVQILHRQLRFLEGSGREFHHQTRTRGNSMLYHHVPYWNAREYTTLHSPKYHSVGRIYLMTSPYYACFYPIISHCIIHRVPKQPHQKTIKLQPSNHSNLPKTGR